MIRNMGLMGGDSGKAGQQSTGATPHEVIPCDLSSAGTCGQQMWGGLSDSLAADSLILRS